MDLHKIVHRGLLVDVINYAKFYLSRFRGIVSVGGEIFGISVETRCRLYDQS